MTMDAALRQSAESVIGHTFRDPGLLERALTHASVAESRGESNERLEFLGDAVLGLIVCRLLYEKFPHLMEGEMTKIKSTAVSRQTCSTIAYSLGLHEMLSIGKGMMTNGSVPSSLAAGALEAVIGAIYLDAGYEAASAFVVHHVEPLIDSAAASGHQQNFKSVLQQHAQYNFDGVPVYRILDEQGPDHAKCFKVCVEISNRRFPATWAQTKKRAEQLAALEALRELGLIENLPNGDVKICQPAGEARNGK